MGSGSSSQPGSPAENAIQPAPPAPNGVAEALPGLERAIASKIMPSRINTATSSLSQSSISPISPSASKKGHSRQASLGTTMTSPSTRRRSLESTMSLIQGVLDGSKPARIEEHDDMNGLTDKLAGSSVGKNAASNPGASRSAGR